MKAKEGDDFMRLLLYILALPFAIIFDVAKRSK